MKRDGERIGRPLPRLRELRHEPYVTDRVQARADVGELVVEQLGDGAALTAHREGREERLGIGASRDDENAASRGGVAATAAGDGRDAQDEGEAAREGMGHGGQR